MALAVSRRAVLMLPLVVALAGCDMSLGNLAAKATDEWTHTYPLTAGGEVRIVNTNGRSEVEGVDGSTRLKSVPSASPRAPPTTPRKSSCRASSSRKTPSPTR